MSYRNPQIFTADPTAFAKGFQTTFDAFQKEFEDEKQRKKELAEKADLAEAMALRKSDLSAFQKIDAQLMKSFQSGIDEIIETDRFKNASKADQERMIREVSYTKGTIGKINEMLSVENDNWDIRNDDAISELRNAMLTGDESIQISGGGLDMAISFKNDKGESKTVTLGDIANTNFRLTEDYKDELKKIDNDFIKEAEARYKESVAAGVDPEDIENDLLEIYKSNLSRDIDLISYAYSNELPPSMQPHSIIYGDDRFSPETREQQTKEQNEVAVNYLAQRALDGAYNSSHLLGASRAKLQREQLESDIRLQNLLNAQQDYKTKKHYNDALQDFKELSGTLSRLESGELGWINDVAEMAKNPDFYKDIDEDFINNMASIGFTHDKTGWNEKSEVNEYKLKHISGKTITLSPRANNINSTADALLNWSRLAVETYDGLYNNDPNFIYKSPNATSSNPILP